jgi:hypothetical protein
MTSLQHQRRLAASRLLLSKLTREHDRRERLYREAVRVARRGR